MLRIFTRKLSLSENLRVLVLIPKEGFGAVAQVRGLVQSSGKCVDEWN